MHVAPSKNGASGDVSFSQPLQHWLNRSVYTVLGNVSNWLNRTVRPSNLISVKRVNYNVAETCHGDESFSNDDTVYSLQISRKFTNTNETAALAYTYDGFSCLNLRTFPWSEVLFSLFVSKLSDI